MPLEKSLGGQHFKALFELAPFAAALASLDGFMVLTNQRFLDAFGYSEEEVVKVHFSEIIHPDYAESSQEDFGIMMSGKPVVIEKRFVRKDGSIFWGRFHGNLVKDQEGNPSHLNGLIHDITEERVNRKWQERAKFCIDNTTDGVAWVKEDGSFVFTNRAYAELVCKPYESMSSLKIWEVIKELTPQAWAGQWAALTKVGSQTILVQMGPGEEPKKVEISTSMITVEGEKLSMAFARDISFRLEAESKLKRSEEQFRAVFDNSPFSIVLSTPERIVREVNTKFSRDFGYSKEEVVGMSIDTFISRDELDAQKEQYQNLFESGSTTGFRKAKCKDGSHKWMKLTATIVPDSEGLPHYALGMLEDVTDYREAQLKLEQALFSMDSSRDSVAWTTEDSSLIYANESYSNMVGIPMTELMGKRVIDINDAVNQAEWESMWQKAKAQKHYVDETYFKSGDTIVPLEISLNFMEFDGKETMHAYIRDITDRKKAEEEIRTSEESFRILFEENPQGIVLISTEGRFLNSNRRFAEMFGYEPLEILEMGVGDLSVEGERLDSQNMFERAMTGEVLRSIRTYCKKDGDLLHARLTSTTITDENDAPRFVLAMIEDLTVQQQAEALQQRQSELERSNKELSQFVHIASHDLREPMRTVKSLGDMLKRRHSEKLDAHGKQCIEFIGESTDRMNELVMGLLEYSRLGGEKISEDVEVSALVADILSDYAVQVKGANAKVTFSGLSQIRGFKHELRILVQNLISNAIKFRADDRPPVIEVHVMEERGYWHLTVSDNGIGIPLAHYDRIFYIFQRLHNRIKYEGTGIGLAHCMRIAELHGGKIWVESEVGEGSTFHVLISTHI